MKTTTRLQITFCLLTFFCSQTAIAQWTIDAPNNEVELTNTEDFVLIGTTMNVSNLPSEDAKVYIVGHNPEQRSITRIEADYQVESFEEILRLVMPTSSSANAQFIDIKRGSTTVFEIDRDGDIIMAGDLFLGGEFDVASDRRFKKNILPVKGALNTIMQLNPVSYDLRGDEFPSLHLSQKNQTGFIAQELEQLLPDAVSSKREVTNVHGDTFDAKSVNYLKIIPLLTRAIQEQQEEIAALKVELQGMKER